MEPTLTNQAASFSLEFPMSLGDATEDEKPCLAALDKGVVSPNHRLRVPHGLNIELASVTLFLGAGTGA